MTIQVTRVFRGLWLLAILLPTAAMAQIGGKDPVEDAMEAFERQVWAAKKQFDASVARSADNTVKRLIALGEGAARNKNDDFAGRAFKEALRIERARPRIVTEQPHVAEAVRRDVALVVAGEVRGLL